MNTPTGKKKLHHRIAHHAKHWFIPHEGNDHRPHALRPRALKTYAYILLTAKIASAAFLFIAFPNQAKYAAYTASTIVAFTNESRIAKNLGTLQSNPLLVEAATRKGKDMLARNYFAHTTPDGKRFWTWIDATGYNYTLAGENLAVDFTSPESAHEALMASPTHRENILNKRYKEIGVAVVTGKMGDVETTVLVEMFGTQAPKKTTTAKVATKPKTTTPKPATVKPVTKPTPKPQVRAEETPKPKGDVTQQSFDQLTLTTSTTADVWVEFKNTGEQAWKAGTVSLITDPATRISSFADASWASTSVVTEIAEDVAPQEVIRVEFKVAAAATPGSNQEKLVLADASGTAIVGTNVSLNLAATTPTVVSNTTPTPTQTDLTQPTPTGPEPEPTPQLTNISNSGIIGFMAGFGSRFFMAFIFFLTIALLINIFVKVRIQHAHVIGQSLAVIALAATALLLKTHFLEQVTNVVRVLGS